MGTLKRSGVPKFGSMVFHGVNLAGRQKNKIERQQKNGKSRPAYKTASAVAGPDVNIANPGEPDPAEAGPDPEALAVDEDG